MRISRSVLREAGGEIPPAYSPNTETTPAPYNGLRRGLTGLTSQIRNAWMGRPPTSEEQRILDAAVILIKINLMGKGPAGAETELRLPTKIANSLTCKSMPQ